MYDMDSLFSNFPNPEMIPVMKRAFDMTSATIHTWGACGTVFTESETEALIADDILTLAKDGETNADALSGLALSHFGLAALDKVAQDVRVCAENQAMEDH